MTNIKHLFLSCTLVLCISAPAMATFDADHFTAVTERGMELWHVPGMSVAVVTGEEILLQKGFGNTALSNGQAVDEHTLFAIASTTKAMGVAVSSNKCRVRRASPSIKRYSSLPPSSSFHLRWWASSTTTKSQSQSWAWALSSALARKPRW